MGRSRQHQDRSSLVGCKRDHYTASANVPANTGGCGRTDSLHCQDMKRLCSAVLRFLGQSEPDRIRRVCNIRQLQDHVTACRGGTEVGEGAVHIALMALESMGAVTRIGHGPDALYAASMQCMPALFPVSYPKGSPAGGSDLQVQQSGLAGNESITAQQGDEQTSAIVHVSKSTVNVKIPLLCIDQGIQKRRLPTPGRREARSSKGGAKQPL